MSALEASGVIVRLEIPPVFFVSFSLSNLIPPLVVVFHYLLPGMGCVVILVKIWVWS